MSFITVHSWPDVQLLYSINVHTQCSIYRRLLNILKARETYSHSLNECWFLKSFSYRARENGKMQTYSTYVMSNTERHGCLTMHPGHIQVPYSFRSACYRETATASRTPASTTPVRADEAAVS